MKIIRAGQPYSRTPWAGFKVNCSRCKAIFELEAEDKMHLVPDQHDGDFYTMHCPSCGAIVNVKQSLIKDFANA